YSPTATSDLIYKGDRTKWRRAAWTLRLRYAMHLAKRKGNLTDADAILANTSAIFITANADDFQFVFGTPGAETGPRRNYESNRGDIRAGKFIVDLMNATSDPRRGPYFTAISGAYIGSGPGESRLTASRMGPFYGTANSPVLTLTNVEYQFIVAEVRFKQGTLAAAATAYNDAVRASLTKHGIVLTDPAVVTWLAANAAETATTITLAKIMTAKYIGLYLQTQVWSDWRRTGLPDLPLATGATEVAIPRRYPYPLNERLYNPNMPAGLTLLTRMYWDMQ
ncbi:MAG: SusD/RagB family nutrient-binding outer membrane lipoprotein, partial [Bacteroidales bacterium]|nr:SusD/RagB family nutrient-binding outer membrane lipoprotein [Bacteroidales bacterium]